MYFQFQFQFDFYFDDGTGTEPVLMTLMSDVDVPPHQSVEHAHAYILMMNINIYPQGASNRPYIRPQNTALILKVVLRSGETLRDASRAETQNYSK